MFEAIAGRYGLEKTRIDRRGAYNASLLGEETKQITVTSASLCFLLTSAVSGLRSNAQFKAFVTSRIDTKRGIPDVLSAGSASELSDMDTPIINAPLSL